MDDCALYGPSGGFRCPGYFNDGIPPILAAFGVTPPVSHAGEMHGRFSKKAAQNATAGKEKAPGGSKEKNASRGSKDMPTDFSC
jgi:hypothetical protein